MKSNNTSKPVFSKFEVMKYNPKNRDSEGLYIVDEWIDCEEIGNTFNGKVFTVEEYIKTENQYIAAIKFLFNYYNCEKINLTDMEFFSIDKLNILKKEELMPFYNGIIERKIILFSEIEITTKMILRGMFNAVFQCKSNNGIKVEFGYDFYMSFTSFEKDKEEITKHIENKIQLFTHR
jgi:hypothetical protein